MDGEDLIIEVPAFARISDYAGLWCLEEMAFRSLLMFADSPALKTHIEAAAGAATPQAAPVETIPAPGGKSIAIVKMMGLLMKSRSSAGGTSTIDLRKQIRTAATDPNISAILIAADSPGGTVSGAGDLAAEIKAAAKQKPTWVHADDLLASAAYWAASGADRIVANHGTALIGSIGTMQQINDISSAAEKAGIKSYLFATGNLKGLGSPGLPVTPEQQTHVQALVESVQSHFDAAVMKGRGMNATQLKAVRHGGVMNAEDAMHAGLIDAIQPLSKTLAELTQAAKDGSGMDRRRAEFDTGEMDCVGSFPTVQRITLPMLEEQRQ